MTVDAIWRPLQRDPWLWGRNTPRRAATKLNAKSGTTLVRWGPRWLGGNHPLQVLDTMDEDAGWVARGVGVFLKFHFAPRCV